MIIRSNDASSVVTSGAISQAVKSTCSVNAIDGNPSSAARAHDPAIEPATASHDHSVWVCPSDGYVGI